MNKIYKVIWSKAKHCYVVASELAKNHTKGCGKRSLRRTAVSLGIVATLLGGFSGSAWADGSGTIAANATGVITAGDNITISAYTVSGSGYDAPITTITISATDTNTTYTAGNGITITGDANAIAVKAGTNVTVDANGVSVVGTNTISSGGTNLATSGGVYTALTAGTFALSGSTLNAAGNATVGGTLGVAGSSALDGGITVATNKFTVDTNGNATVGSLKIGTTSYGITSEGAATVSLLTIGSTNVGETLAAKADAADVSALNTKTQYVASAGENKTTIAGTLEVVGTNAESGGVINVSGPGSGVNIAGTESFLKVGSGSSNYTLEVDVGNNQVKAASGNIIFNSNGAFTTKYGGSTGQTIFEVNPESNANPIPVLIFNGGINGTATFNGAGDNKVTLKNGAITATGAISGKTIMATDNLYIGTGTNQIDVAAAVAGSGVIAATGETGASGLVKGSTVYDYLNGTTSNPKLALGANSTIIQIGKVSSVTGTQPIAIGLDASATDNFAISIGSEAKANKYGTVAVGYQAYASGSASGGSSTAVGNGAYANGKNALAIGGGTTAGSFPNGGRGAKATADNAIAVGYKSVSSGESAIAIGSTDSTDTTIATTTASGDSSIAIGKSAKAEPGYTIAIGANAKVNSLSGTGTIAIGYNANAYGNDPATAIGRGATSFQGTAIGYSANANGAGATALGGFTNANSEYATAVGVSANANSEYATAVGAYAQASGLNSIAIGGGELDVTTDPSNPVFTGAETTAENAIAVGFKSVSSGTNAIAIGSNTSATVANSVALGSGAVANRADYATTNYKAYLNEDDSKTDSAWRSTHSAVAVGNGTTATRQITGVAAGTEDTDAVNVAQLKSATPVINSEHNYYVGTTTAGVKVTDAVDAVDKALGKITENGNYITVYNATTPSGRFADNLKALDTAIGKVTSDGNYIKESSSKNVAENLSLLDAQAKTNADNIGTLQIKTQNITATAGTTKMEGVLNVVPTGETTGIAISGTDKTITGLSNKTWDATNITSGRAATEDQLKLAASSLSTTLTDTGLQFGANLNTATNNDTVVTNKLGSKVKVIGGGAQSGHTYSAANVTTEITQDAAGNSTITIKLDENPTFKSLTTTGNISGASIAASGMLSGASLKVNGIDVTTPLTTTGAVASGNAGYVTGGTVYGEVRPTADGNFVKTANKTADNLTALDTQVKTNADNITALQSSTTAAVGTLTEDGNYIKKSATNNIVQNLSALDTQVKKNTDDIATLQNSITVKEDASGTKTTTIEGNLVIKEKNGTTKDVTVALSTDGEVAKQGDAGSEGYLKGETVYEYLNKDSLELGANSTKIAMGSESKINSGTKSIAIGFDNTVDGDQNVVIGTGHEVKGNNNIAVGDPINIDGNDNGVFSNTATVTGNRTYAMGYQVTITGNDTVVLGNNINGTASNAVVLGNNSTPEDGAVSIGSVGGERQIKHVAPGTDANDAATVGQLGALAQAADNGINRLDRKVNKVGAGAAALAALHPIDTDDKFTMGLGYGNYRNAHSAAIGLFYRPTEKVMISVGGTLGNGENMINAGISFALDKGKGFGTSKAAMARKIAEQGEEIQSLKAENAKLAERLAAIEAKLGK